MNETKYYVLGFAFNTEKTEVVLIKKNRPNWQKDKYNGVGGKVEKDEPHMNAMIREFREETGVETDSNDWESIATMTFGEDILGGSAEVSVYVSNGDYIAYNASTKTDELISVIPVKELSELPVCPNVPLLIQLCLQKEFNWITLHQLVP